MSSNSRRMAVSLDGNRFRAFALMAAATGLMIFGMGCKRGQPGKPQPAPAPVISQAAVPNNLNIVLITIDTLRTDRISCYGSDRVQTPTLDAFAEEGIRFSNAASTVPFTLPAHSSIMTGLYPPGHGVRENVGYTLDSSIPTLAEVLSSQGWSTAGFVSSFVLDRRWGIGRGFDHYFDDFDVSGMEKKANLSSVQRSGDVTIAEAIRWLDQRPTDQPFFMWLHLYDPHDPYTPPEPFKSQYPKNPYDAEVAYTDSLIGDFRHSLVERGLLDESLIILTADHGEGLGDHGESSHGYFLYDTTIHVGMIVRPPNARTAGRVVDAAVSHVDLFPTILDWVGVHSPRSVHGWSLLELIDGEDDGSDRQVYSESLYPLLHYGWAPLRAIRSGNSKLINAPRPEVFDLGADPGETTDLSSGNPAVTDSLLRQLDTLRAEIEVGAPEEGTAADLDPETLAQLQALGYAAGQGGVSIDQEDDRPRADPKDKIGLHKRIMMAQSQMVDEPTAAAENLTQILAEDPEVIDAHQMLGQIAMVQNEYQDALGHYGRALQLTPDHKNSLMGMAAAYQALERFDEALVGFRRALDLSGNDTRATLAIADIEFGLGNLDQAAGALEEAVPTTEAPALINNKLGEVRFEQGRSDEAIRLFETAIAEKDAFALPHFNLAVLLEERGAVPQAIERYEHAIELAPNYYEAQFNLGRILGKMGQVDRQRELWETSIESNPSFVQGYYYLSKLLMDTGGDLRRAEELVRLGIGKDPEETEGPLGYYLLADILGRTGRGAEAMKAAEEGKRMQSEIK